MADAQTPRSTPAEADPAPRRTFLARIGGALAASTMLPRVLRSTSHARPADAASPPPNATPLEALGEAVLPTAALGRDGTRQAVVAFDRWMAGYRPGAEANHGYGTARIGRLPADPRPAWRAQLSALDREARARGAASFAALSLEGRQSLVQVALAGERGESLPSPLVARHIALAMLAHFYASPAATDLCYEAVIGRQECRPLAVQRERPVALRRRTP